MRTVLYGIFLLALAQILVRACCCLVYDTDMRSLRDSIFCCICIAEFALLIMGMHILDSKEYQAIINKQPEYYRDFDSFFETVVWLPGYAASLVCCLICAVLCLYVVLV